MNPASFKILEITEYQPHFFSREEISEEVGIILYEKYQSQVNVEFPSPKTRNQWKLTANGYVGYIPLNADLALKINPKVPIKNLFGKLEYVYNLKSFKLLEGLMNCESLEDFYNHLAYVLADKIIERCRKGLYRTYVPKTEQFAYVRGRLNVQQIIKKPWNVKLQCAYQEHTADIIDNQILLWTLFHIGHSGFCTEKVSLIVRKAYHAMQGMVSLQPCSSEDCIDRIYHRLNEDYHILHQFCRFFLDNTIPDHEKGKNTTLPFLVNMARLYEMFVAEWLKGNLPQNFTLKTQERINIGENIYFQTDLILYNTTDSKPKYILDTKYKNPKHSSHEDIAQVVTYAVSKDCPETVLVYPTELNHSLDKYLGKIRVRNLTFSLDDKIEDAGNTFLTKLFS